MPRGIDIGNLAVSDQPEARQIAIVVEHQVQFHRAFSSLELRPVIHRQAQVNDGRIEADQFVFEPEFLFAGRFAGNNIEQCVEDLLEQLRRAVAVGVGQGRVTLPL